ncbi:alcohol oxidase [Ascobolus immersus RN42]|uniref:Alcohol oxidase n=1 Tax=Ascobolus immersus RN42 TaxID=1160509 RepID=A0A3N4HN78_ASCIM|nr:alcohol oxidase [Ascobolus immersus RN42]
MRFINSTYVALAISLATQSVVALPGIFPGKVLQSRDELLPEYDYVVVGGGMAGLVVAGRITEKSQKTVLVIEAGPLVDGPAEYATLLQPGQWTAAFQYLWFGINSEPNKGLNNRTDAVLNGKVVGGGSAVNGLNYNKDSAGQYDLWATLTGSSKWGWDKFLPYLKKPEDFHPPTPEYKEELGATYDLSEKGQGGPIDTTYPPFRYPQTQAYFEALGAMGVPKTNGSIGRFWIPTALNPTDMTRSYSKIGYHEPASSRPNYHLLPGNQVTKILFDSNKRVTGVQYASGPGETTYTVKAKKEVVLSAGAVFSPKILLQSGIGEKKKLQSLNIPVVADIPGVGWNFQDHTRFDFKFSFTFNRTNDPLELQRNQTYYNEMQALYLNNQTGPLTLTVGNAGCALDLKSFTNTSTYTSILASALATNPIAALPSNIPATVKAGYIKQRIALLASIKASKIPVASFLSFLDFTPAVVLTKPLSRGFVTVNSASPWDFPIVDYRTHSDPFDMAVVTNGIRYARRILQTPPVVPYNPQEIFPGAEVTDDSSLAEAVRSTALATFGHPFGTCKMGKLQEGAVVDAELKVYGVKGLRVIDASIIPVATGPGPMASVYGIGERGAAFILGEDL